MFITDLTNLNVLHGLGFFLCAICLYVSQFLVPSSIIHYCVFIGLSLAGAAANAITGYTSGVASVVNVDETNIGADISSCVEW